MIAKQEKFKKSALSQQKLKSSKLKSMLPTSIKSAEVKSLKSNTVPRLKSKMRLILIQLFFVTMKFHKRIRDIRMEKP